MLGVCSINGGIIGCKIVDVVAVAGSVANNEGGEVADPCDGGDSESIAWAAADAEGRSGRYIRMGIDRTLVAESRSARGSELGSVEGGRE